MSIEAAVATSRMLLRRGLALEYLTLAWNVVGTIVLVLAAIASGSVALAGFGVDSLVEIPVRRWWSGSSRARRARSGSGVRCV